MFKAFKSRREQAILGMPEWNEIVAHHISQHLHVGHTPFTAVRYVGFSVLLKAVRSKPGLQPGEGQELQRLLTDQRIHSRSGWLVRGAISAWLDNLLDVSRKPASAKTDMLVRNLHQGWEEEMDGERGECSTGFGHTHTHSHSHIMSNIHIHTLPGRCTWTRFWYG